jgi:hypothetical protein
MNVDQRETMIKSSAIYRPNVNTPWRSWIRASWYNYENNQKDALYRLIHYSKSAVHVSWEVSAHH